MEIKATFPVQFEDSIGQLQFPANLKRSTAATVCCYHMYVQSETREEECLQLKCDSSYFRDQNFTKKLNTLAIFPLCLLPKAHSFQCPPLPLTVAPESIEFKIVDANEDVKKVTATALIHIVGTCQERVRHI